MQATHSGVVINLLPFRSGNVTRLVTIIVNFTIAFETRDLHLEKSVQTLYGIYTSDIRKLVALYNNTMMSVSQWTKSIETSSDTNFKYKKMNKLELFIKFFNLRFTVFIMTMLTPL